MPDGTTFPTRPSLVSMSDQPLPAGTYGVSLGAHRRGDGRWVVTQDAHCIDRCGEKDTYTDTLSVWGDEAAAKAALAQLAPRAS